MSNIPKLRKWHFLALGGLLVFLAAYLWCWGWRFNGIPYALYPEYCLVMASFILGIFVLGLFIYRLTRRQVTIVLVAMVLVNLAAALISVWIIRSYPAFLDFLSPKDFQAVDAKYIQDWLAYFVKPALYLIHGGLLILWLGSLVMFFVRKPTDQPD